MRALSTLWLGTLLVKLTLAAAPAAASVHDVAVGSYHTCALLDSGQVKCWGFNDFGQLGLGDARRRGSAPSQMGTNLPTVALGTGARATQVAAGGFHSCALLSTGTVKCWGFNDHGQLGLGDTGMRGALPEQMGDALPAVELGANRRAIKLSVGAAHSCALLDDGKIKCWGQNDRGQLGLGDVVDRGSAAGQMGDTLPAVDLGANTLALDISAGTMHSCAVLATGAVKCWGEGDSGRLGLGDVNGRGAAAGQMGDALTPVDLGAGVLASKVVAYEASTCALLRSGGIKCWGANDGGQLGLGHLLTLGDATGEMGAALPTVTLMPDLPTRALSCSGGHCCATFVTNTAQCWGLNRRGALGLQDGLDRGGDPTQMGVNLPFVALGSLAVVKSVVAGRHHSCAILDRGALKCWGANHYGQLGLGSTRTRGDVQGSMGDGLPAVDLD